MAFLQTISQLRNGGTGAVKWHSCAKWWFRSSKTPCKMGLWLRNWEFLCFVAISQLQNTLRNGALAAKLGIFMLWSFAAISQLRNKGYCAAKWHSCAKSCFAAAKIFTKRGLWLRTGFAAKCRFRRGCEISQTPVFSLFLLQTIFLQFLCNSSWFWSSKNLYYIITN